MTGLTNHARATLSMMRKFYVRNEYWDIQVEVDGRLFKCQRALLAATSEYIDDLFIGKKFTDSTPTSDTRIRLEGLDATAFEDILHFMYTGNVRANDSNILQLFRSNYFLKLRTKEFKKKCVNYLVIRSTQPCEPKLEAIELFWFARREKEDLQAFYLSLHIIRHLYHFLKDAQLMETTFENLKWLLECGDNLIPLPGSSDALLAIIHNWVRHDREERSQYRCELIRIIDSSRVSSDFLSKVKTLEMEEINVDDIGGSARLLATISLNVKNISQLSSSWKVFSSPSIISNLSWRTCVEREKDDVTFFLQCDGTNLTPEWLCHASASFTIKSREGGRNDFKFETAHGRFSSVTLGLSCLECKRGMKFCNLINPNKGFIEDDSITLDAHVYAGHPFRANPFSRDE